MFGVSVFFIRSVYDYFISIIYSKYGFDDVNFIRDPRL